MSVYPCFLDKKLDPCFLDKKLGRAYLGDSRRPTGLGVWARAIMTCVISPVATCIITPAMTCAITPVMPCGEEAGSDRWLRGKVRGGSREVAGVCEEEAGERQVVAGRKQGGGRWWLGGSRGRQEVAGSQQGGSVQMGQSSGGHSGDQLCGEELGAVAPAHPQPGRVQGS